MGRQLKGRPSVLLSLSIVHRLRGRATQARTELEALVPALRESGDAYPPGRSRARAAQPR